MENKRRFDQIKKEAKTRVVNSVDTGMYEETAWVYGFCNGAGWVDAELQEALNLLNQVDDQIQFALLEDYPQWEEINDVSKVIREFMKKRNSSEKN